MESVDMILHNIGYGLIMYEILEKDFNIPVEYSDLNIKMIRMKKSFK